MNVIPTFTEEEEEMLIETIGLLIDNIVSEDPLSITIQIIKREFRKI